MSTFRRRHPMGYERFVNFVKGKDLSSSSKSPSLDVSDVPPARPGGTAFVRERTPLLLFPFVHVYNKLRYTVVAKIVGVFVIAALMVTGSWVVVFRDRVLDESSWLEGRSDVVIAVLGKDDVEGGARSDALMLVNCRPKEQEIRILSIPRDSYVPIARPNRRGGVNEVFSKINHALRWGGHELTLDTIRRYTGIEPDFYVLVGYGLFVELVDFVGGIPLEVEDRMYYVDRAGGLTIDLQPGFQVLDGDKALQYVRFRADGQGDIGRIARQQKFVAAAVEHVKQPQSFFNLLNSAPQLLQQDHVSTNLTIESVLSLLLHFREITRADVIARTIPGRDMMLPVRAGSSTRLAFYVSSREQVMSSVNDFFLSSSEQPGSAEPESTAFPDIEELGRELEGADESDDAGADLDEDITSHVVPASTTADETHDDQGDSGLADRFIHAAR